MRPITVLNGILLGTTGAIAICLAVVVLLFLILQGETPQLAEEIGPLSRLAAVFWVAGATSAASFYGHLTLKPWRWWAQLAALVVVVLGSFYLLATVQG